MAIESGNRSRAEKSCTMLKKDIEDIASRLEETGSNTATQVELNKKMEGELGASRGSWRSSTLLARAPSLLFA